MKVFAYIDFDNWRCYAECKEKKPCETITTLLSVYSKLSAAKKREKQREEDGVQPQLIWRHYRREVEH